MEQTTRNNPAPGTQPRDKSILIPLTFEQKIKLSRLAAEVRMSQAALIRLLIDRFAVERALSGATLTDNSTGGNDR